MRRQYGIRKPQSLVAIFTNESLRPSKTRLGKQESPVNVSAKDKHDSFAFSAASDDPSAALIATSAHRYALISVCLREGWSFPLHAEAFLEAIWPTLDSVCARVIGLQTWEGSTQTSAVGQAGRSFPVGSDRLKLAPKKSSRSGAPSETVASFIFIEFHPDLSDPVGFPAPL